MKLIKQNDIRLIQDIREIGCFFRSAQAMAEMKAGTTLTADQINVMWHWAKINGHIENRIMVHGAIPIANKTLKYLGCPGRFFEVGLFKNGKTSYYKSIPKHLQRIDFLIQKANQVAGAKYKHHFRNVDRFGEVIFDPYEPAVEVSGAEYSILFAYVED